MRYFSWIRTIIATLIFIPLAGYLHARNALTGWKYKRTQTEEKQHDCHALHVR